MKCASLLCYFILPTDDTATAFIKKLVVAVTLVIIMMTCFSLSATPGDILIRTRRFVMIAFSAALMLQIVIEKRARPLLIEAYFYFVGVMFCFADLIAIPKMYGHRSWPYFVPIIDACLVCKMPSRVTTNLIAMLLIWFVVVAIESSFRFGLFDLYFLTSQEDRFERVNCSKLPCKQSVGLSVQSMAGASVVFLLDFYFTRGFAHGLQKEHDKMNKVIAAAEQISTSLSRFDLASAESVLNAASLPDPLSDSFNRILSNLHIYRPYLPQSCLQGEDFTDSTSECEGMGDHVSSQESQQSRGIESPFKSFRHQPEFMREPERKRCTFTVTNMLGSHEEASRDIVAYQARFKEFMEVVVSCYSRVSGVVGVVVGDHVHASFNAVKRCASHAERSVEGAVDLHTDTKEKGIDVVTGVASGTAFCGPLGCSDLMSVVTIGPSAVVASLMQDFGKVRGLKVVCSGIVYSEVSHAFTMRIILGKVVVAGQETVELGYEVLMESNDKKSEKAEEEWMYQLEERPWDCYNTAGKQYLLGEAGEALRVLGIERVKSDEVLSAEAQLAETIQNDTT